GLLSWPPTRPAGGDGAAPREGIVVEPSALGNILLPGAIVSVDRDCIANAARAMRERSARFLPAGTCLALRTGQDRQESAGSLPTTKETRACLFSDETAAIEASSFSRSSCSAWPPGQMGSGTWQPPVTPARSSGSSLTRSRTVHPVLCTTSAFSRSVAIGRTP